jgi:hypothetical protein
MVSFHRISIVSPCTLYILSNNVPSAFCPYHCHDKTSLRMCNVPLRLLDCLGLDIPFCFFAVLVDLGVAVGLRFGGGGGSGAGFTTGEERKADGDGIVIVSILTISYRDTSTIARQGAAIYPVRRSWRCVVGIKSTLSRDLAEAAGIGGSRCPDCKAVIGGLPVAVCQKQNVETRPPNLSEQLPPKVNEPAWSQRSFQASAAVLAL